jgi:trehalose/maltose transport system substrate-binding protein
VFGAEARIFERIIPADLIRYLSSAELQKRIGIRFSVLPTRPALYNDPDVLAINPYLIGT